MNYRVELAGRDLEIVVDGDTVRLHGRALAVRLLGRRGDVARRLVISGRSREIVVLGGERGQWRLSAEGHCCDVTVLDARARALRTAGPATSAHITGTIRAPMPGLVVRVLVEEGQAVEAGTGLVVVEAMKMENELKAPGAGRVLRVHVKAGDRVERGQGMVEVGEE